MIKWRFMWDVASVLAIPRMPAKPWLLTDRVSRKIQFRCIIIIIIITCVPLVLGETRARPSVVNALSPVAHSFDACVIIIIHYTMTPSLVLAFRRKCSNFTHVFYHTPGVCVSIFRLFSTFRTLSPAPNRFTRRRVLCDFPTLAPLSFPWGYGERLYSIQSFRHSLKGRFT